LYSLFLALDANFRLKRKDISSDKRDGGLGLGWAYIVNNEPYKEHLARYKDEVEPVSFSNPFSWLALTRAIHRKVIVPVTMLSIFQLQNQTGIMRQLALLLLSVHGTI
jgi:hypothetical protein